MNDHPDAEAMAYANRQDRLLMAAALLLAARRIREEVTCSTRTEQFGRDQAIEKLVELAEGLKSDDPLKC